MSLDGISLSLELSVAVIETLVSLFVDDYDSLNDIEALLLDQLVQIQVVELAWQVADMEGR